MRTLITNHDRDEDCFRHSDILRLQRIETLHNVYRFVRIHEEDAYYLVRQCDEQSAAAAGSQYQTKCCDTD